MPFTPQWRSFHRWKSDLMHIDSFNVLSKTSEESNRYMKVGAIEQQYSAQLQSDSTLKTHYNNLKRIDRLFLTRYQTLRFTSKLPPPPSSHV